jgi:hypothetical protein
MDLRGSNAASLGSKELDLLAMKTVAPARARQPYFVKARMAAAGLLGATTTADAKQREALLREALAIEPGGEDTDAIRMGIFRAEVALGQDALAISAIKPLVKVLEGSGGGDTERENGAVESEVQPSVTARSTSSADGAERASLLAAVSDVSWKMGDTASAVQYLRAALRFAPKAAQHGAWQQKLTQHQAMIRRAQANASRRPVVHAALDQSIAVRPRLVAGREVR